MATAELGDLSNYKARVAEIESSNNPLEVTGDKTLERNFYSPGDFHLRCGV
jgi:hypothetical protein